MVLSVPPLLEELGTNVTKDVTHALTVWQRALWGAAQRLRERPGQPDGVQRRWMGTTEQLSSVIAGSVVLGGDDTAPDVVPLSTESTPAIKGSPHGPLVRLEGAPGLSGRYASLPKIIGSSVGVWPAAITAGSNGGRNAGGLRARDDRPVELQVVASSSARLAFRLVDAATKEVVAASESAEELARGVGYGARPLPWGAFLEDSLWGLPAVAPQPPEAERSTANMPGVRDLASLWGLEQLRRDEVPLLSLVAFLAAAAELPEPRQLANELTLHWDELTGSAKPLIDGAQLLDATDRLAKAMLLSATSPAVIAAAAPARMLDATSAAIYIGEVMRHSISESRARETTATSFGAIDSPRARRSLVATTGGSSYLTATTPAPASPATPRRRKEVTADVDSEGEPVPSPGSMYAELKRLRKLTAQQSARASNDGPAPKAARHGGTQRTERALPASLPVELTDLTDEVAPAITSAPERTSGATAYAGQGRTAPRHDSARGGMPAAVGPTLGECVRMQHTAEVRRLVPEGAEGVQLKELSALLEAGGMPDAPTAFAQAATTVSTGIVPGRGTALEAEMLAEHIAQVLDDLVVAKALPMTHPAFEGGVRPADWNQAAARGRALILATARAFRTARQLNRAAATGPAGGSSEHLVTPRGDKVPEDSYAKVSEATTTSLKVLAASASVLSSLTTDNVLRGERLRGSPFESLTGNSQAALDAALPGELDYFVGMYGQAATAYLVSNSRSLEEVSGKGVPAALVGIRRHLWLRALCWVQDAFGERRAIQRRADVEKLALSLMAGAVPAEPVGTSGEKLIIELLGGSKPHKGAEVEKEGGSVSTGTVGKLEGETAQFSVRVAYRKWAKGLARCMGEVMLASRGRQTAAAAVLGTECDFGVEEALLNVSDDLPAEQLRSIGRYLLDEIHGACTRHRSQPAAALPDIMAIVADMGGEVFRQRRQEYQLESMAQAAAAKLTETLTARLTALESKLGQATSKGDAGTRSNRAPAAAYSKDNAKSPLATVGTPKVTKSEGKKPASKHDGATKSSVGGLDMDDGAITSTAKRAAKALEDSTTGNASTDVFDSRVRAVAALQAIFRKSVGSPASRRLDDKEPCAWLALAGKCKEKACKSCASGLEFDAATIQAIKARCAAGLFDGAKQPVKDPG